MPSQALSDPRRERTANDLLDAPDGRCDVCHAPLTHRGRWPVGAPRSSTPRCSPRCRMFAWRRNGDPDGPLDHRKRARRPAPR